MTDNAQAMNGNPHFNTMTIDMPASKVHAHGLRLRPETTGGLRSVNVTS